MINHKHPQYQLLNAAQHQAINLMHVARAAMITAANNDVKSAQAIYPSWLALETALQRLWGFPEDINYVRVWEYPHCSCPKIDNEDSYPHGYYVSSGSCPIHGSAVEPEKKKKKKSTELKDVLNESLTNHMQKNYKMTGFLHTKWEN